MISMIRSGIVVIPHRIFPEARVQGDQQVQALLLADLADDDPSRGKRDRGF
jgi:hypothetical protein